jgi:hypothetical protein
MRCNIVNEIHKMKLDESYDLSINDDFYDVDVRSETEQVGTAVGRLIYMYVRYSF